VPCGCPEMSSGYRIRTFVISRGGSPSQRLRPFVERSAKKRHKEHDQLPHESWSRRTGPGPRFRRIWHRSPVRDAHWSRCGDGASSHRGSAPRNRHRQVSPICSYMVFLASREPLAGEWGSGTPATRACISPSLSVPLLTVSRNSSSAALLSASTSFIHLTTTVGRFRPQGARCFCGRASQSLIPSSCLVTGSTGVIGCMGDNQHFHRGVPRTQRAGRTSKAMTRSLMPRKMA